MSRLALAASFAAALGTQACHDESNKPIPGSASTVYEIANTDPDIIFIQANLRLAREKFMGGRNDNARTAFLDAVNKLSLISTRLSPNDRAPVETDIANTRRQIAACLDTDGTNP